VPEKKAKSFTFDVVGLNHRVHRGKQEILAYVVRNMPLDCRLQREPDNEHDPNAVMVYIDDERLEAYFRVAVVHIGYIRRGTAAVIASGLDAGRLEVRRCRLFSVYPERGEGKIRVAFLKTPVLKRKTRT
jgi:hypothetical protein